MQNFFTTTLVSKFIKYLLMTTPLPTCSFLNDCDIMVEGNFYIYRGNVYKCTRTGIFKGSHKYTEGHLCCAETVYCSNDLVVTDSVLKYSGKRLAEYNIVDSIYEGKSIYGITEEFMSTNSHYDMATHRKLGDYLRFLKSQYGLDLMSLYNCFCNYYVDNIDISSGALYDAHNKNYKVTLVPIKFNRRYTVAFNTNAPVYMKPVIYDGKLVRDPKKGFIYDNLYTEITKVSFSTYDKPTTIAVWNTDPYAQSFEKNLYLAIQMPVSNVTTVTVLEGEFRNYNFEKINDIRLFTTVIEPYVDAVMVSKCSLLRQSVLTKSMEKSLPFSDRLVEYLVQHTIDPREQLTENVERVSNTFGYSNGYPGIWDNYIRGKLFDGYLRLQDKREELVYEDLLGYVDKDIEDALNKGYLRYGNR